MNNDHILTTCRECGNKGLLKKVAQYDQHLVDYCDGEPISNIENNWILLECPVCGSVSLYQRYSNDLVTDDKGNKYYDETIVYPAAKSFPNVPKSILKSYEVAVKTAKVDFSVSLIAIRAVLEKICKERGTKRKNLESMLKEMVTRHILPETLDECGFIIRRMGNNGAHGDDDSMLTSRDITELINFIEIIMYYIYELPIKIDKFNQKYELELEKRDNSAVAEDLEKQNHHSMYVQLHKS